MGRRQLLLAAWPSPSMPKGSVQLGADVWEAIGRPPLGASLSLCTSSAGAP